MSYVSKKEQLLRAAGNLRDAKREHPSTTDVRAGCDCGCGGEDMTEEDWAWYDSELEEAQAVFDKLCEELGIYE